MSCPSAERCIMQTKLVNWDYGTRKTEHQLQLIYRQKRGCTMAPPPIRKYLKKKIQIISSLSRQLSRNSPDKHSQKSKPVPITLRGQTLYLLLKTFVPQSRFLEYSLLTRRNHFAPSELVLSHLADLQPICVGCLPRDTVVNLIDYLMNNRTIRKIPQSATIFRSILAPSGPIHASSWQCAPYGKITRAPPEQHLGQREGAQQDDPALTQNIWGTPGIVNPSTAKQTQSSSASKKMKQPQITNQYGQNELLSDENSFGNVRQSFPTTRAQAEKVRRSSLKSSAKSHTLKGLDTPVDTFKKGRAVVCSPAFVVEETVVCPPKTDYLRQRISSYFVKIPSTERKRLLLRNLLQTVVTPSDMHAQILPSQMPCKDSEPTHGRRRKSLDRTASAGPHQNAIREISFAASPPDGGRPTGARSVIDGSAYAERKGQNAYDSRRKTSSHNQSIVIQPTSETKRLSANSLRTSITDLDQIERRRLPVQYGRLNTSNSGSARMKGKDSVSIESAEDQNNEYMQQEEENEIYRKSVKTKYELTLPRVSPATPPYTPAWNPGYTLYDEEGETRLASLSSGYSPHNCVLSPYPSLEDTLTLTGRTESDGTLSHNLFAETHPEQT